MKNILKDLIYIKASKIIPGGVQLPQRPEIYLPNQWPSYYNLERV